MPNKQTPAVLFFVFCILLAVALIASRKAGAPPADRPGPAADSLPDGWETYEDDVIRFSRPRDWIVDAEADERQQTWHFGPDTYLGAFSIIGREENRTLPAIYEQYRSEAAADAVRSWSRPQKLKLRRADCLGYTTFRAMEALCYNMKGQYFELGTNLPRSPQLGETPENQMNRQHFDRILRRIEFK